MNYWIGVGARDIAIEDLNSYAISFGGNGSEFTRLDVIGNLITFSLYTVLEF